MLAAAGAYACFCDADLSTPIECDSAAMSRDLLVIRLKDLLGRYRDPV